ncbi:MAG: TonB-dependent receptor plug domain-containing protein [Desulfatirhabdiaceae bacterium]|nr:TonB-dependent receptor plug domain-containing protein [Desulfatirhabdiaceae bacterium]
MYRTLSRLNRLFLCFFVLIAPFFLMGATTSDLTSLSLEDLMRIPVYGASKFEQKASNAPSAITIITADDIQKYGYRTLADLLRSVRGFYATYDRNYRYAGIRGFGSTGDYNSRILIQIDGHRINDNIYGQGSIGSEFILDLDLIDKVEIIRGSGSSLYDSNAFFGVINVITKKSKDFGQPGVAGSYGS